VWLHLSGRSFFISFFVALGFWRGPGPGRVLASWAWTTLDVPHLLLELELRAWAPGASCRVRVCVDTVMCFVRVHGRGRGAVAGPFIGLELVRSRRVRLLVLWRSGLYALRVLELELQVRRACAFWRAVLWQAHLSGSSLCL
jgi:hypothetical protein